MLHIPGGCTFLVACVQELRKGKFIRVNSSSRDILSTIAELQLPVESTASMAGVRCEVHFWPIVTPFLCLCLCLGASVSSRSANKAGPAASRPLLQLSSTGSMASEPAAMSVAAVASHAAAAVGRAASRPAQDP